MPANVISLTVLNGSGGYSIAHHVADRMGLRYYDWEITSSAASRAGVSPSDVIAAERVPGFMERMMSRLGAVSAMTVEGGAGFADPSPAVWDTALQSFTSDAYRQVIEQVVDELANQGNAVIVGHAGQHILRDRPEVLKVQITGSLASRSLRLAMEQGIDTVKATSMVKQSDKDRRELLKRLYNFNWLDAANYDLSFNTDRVSVDFAADTIVAAAAALP
jgi:Cytidylate kinase-like family